MALLPIDCPTPSQDEEDYREIRELLPYLATHDHAGLDEQQQVDERGPQRVDPDSKHVHPVLIHGRCTGRTVPAFDLAKARGQSTWLGRT